MDTPTITNQSHEAPGPLPLLDFFFPGFSIFSGAVNKYLHIDLNMYIPLVLLLGGLLFAWRYFSEYFWGQIESHFMSTVDVRTDDEAYNFLMSWVAAQRFARRARRFIVNTNLNSRSWWLFRWDDEEEEEESEETLSQPNSQKKKPLCYTPTFGSHFFWYNGRILIFRRNQNRESGPFLIASEREEISICCFGRDPSILKELLLEAREHYMKRDEKKTLIYRGTIGKASSPDPSWQRCMARTARPFSTVILNEKVKKDLIDDVTDYLNPATRRWYANRGIPYRRGYLLYGPPGTGKSSLSLALAGYFKMKIYIVSLSSVTANEENLASLFAELPRRCVVLLEDIDTAGLTHTRDEHKVIEEAPGGSDMVPGQITQGTPPPSNQGGRLSLSGLLNILDGVASQEGRVLIMTTNHLEKLDKALIRPGRVDMIVKFDKADREMIAAIFRAIFAPLEGDEAPSVPSEKGIAALEAEKQKVEEERKKREEKVEHISNLAEKFADNIPSHEFSPAELQGFLLKNKRDPEGAVAGAGAWVIEARKEKQEKELREAEEKRKAEEEKDKATAEEKKKEEKEKRRKDKKEAKKKSKKKSKKADESEDSSGASSDSESESGSEAEAETEKSKTKSSKKKRKDKKSKKDASDSESSDSEAEVDKEPVKKKENPVEVEKPLKLDTTDDKLKVKADEGKTGADSGYGTP